MEEETAPSTIEMRGRGVQGDRKDHSRRDKNRSSEKKQTDGRIDRLESWREPNIELGGEKIGNQKREQQQR